MSTLNIDEETRKSKFADYSDGDTVSVSFTGTLSGLAIEVDPASLECEPPEMEEEELPEEKAAPPPAVKAVMKGKPVKKGMPPGIKASEEVY